MKPIAVQDVVIAEEVVEEVSEGGIVLPKANKPGRGKVIAVGPGKFAENGQLIPMQVKVDQMIHFKPERFIAYSEGHKNWAIMREADILFIEGSDS